MNLENLEDFEDLESKMDYSNIIGTSIKVLTVLDWLFFSFAGTFYISSILSAIIIAIGEKVYYFYKSCKSTF